MVDDTNCLPKRPKQTVQSQREDLIRVFSVSYYNMNFVNFRPGNQHFIRGQKERSVGNFRTFTVPDIS